MVITITGIMEEKAKEIREKVGGDVVMLHEDGDCAIKLYNHTISTVDNCVFIRPENNTAKDYKQAILFRNDFFEISIV